MHAKMEGKYKAKVKINDYNLKQRVRGNSKLNAYLIDHDGRQYEW